MELKTAVSVCLISLFSATLVVLIARSLDMQTTARLEPKLTRIVEHLEAIRTARDVPTTPAATVEDHPLRDGLVVYYFHANRRCPTCRAIESQSHESVQANFAERLDSGEMAWQTANFEDPAVSELANKFKILTSSVVLARMEEGRIEQWKRLDRLWGLVGNKAAFAEYLLVEIGRMLSASPDASSPAQEHEGPATRAPAGEPDDPPLSSGASKIPIPQ
jgi:hypothetical protein